MPFVVTPLTCHIKYIKKLNQEQNKLNHNALIKLYKCELQYYRCRNVIFLRILIG